MVRINPYPTQSHPTSTNLGPQINFNSNRPLACKTTAPRKTGVSGKTLPAPASSTQPRHRVGNKSLGGKTIYPGHPNYHEKSNRKRRRNKIVAPPPRFALEKRGDGVVHEIGFYQDNSENNLIPRAPFVRLVKEIIQEVFLTRRIRCRIGRGAIDALQMATEAELCTLFTCCNVVAYHAKRITIIPRDFKVVRALKIMLAHSRY